MKIKTANLDWRVLNYDCNSKKVINANVFFSDMPQKIAKDIRNGKIKNKLDLQDWLKSKFMYHYWSRCEYEIIVGNLFCEPEEMEKIDVWRQLEMNLPRITDYVIKEMDIKFDTGK